MYMPRVVFGHAYLPLLTSLKEVTVIDAKIYFSVLDTAVIPLFALTQLIRVTYLDGRSHYYHDGFINEEAE